MDGVTQAKKRKVDGNEKETNGNPYLKIEKDDDDIVLSTSLSFTAKLNGLQSPLEIIQENGGKILQLESRPAKNDPEKHDFLVNLDDDDSIETVCEKIMSALKPVVENVDKHGGEKVPWFPRHIDDLDKFADRVLSYGAELNADHPGFTDPVYRARRKEFADIAINHRHQNEIPNVTYTEEEIKTCPEEVLHGRIPTHLLLFLRHVAVFLPTNLLTQCRGTIFKNLTKLYPSHACKELNDVFPELIKECDYKEDTIPQLRKVSRFLKGKTGFQLRPVAGLLSSRDFLAGLAFRVFHSTQYIRHSSMPMYTPEPDVCHELIGHVPLFANPEFARFSQEIGLLSLGISDDWVMKLATLYWFTVEFGLCRQKGELKAYGAGLLSSFGELQYCIESDKCRRLPFEPEKACVQEYPITKFQPIYFVANSFDDAKEKLRSWACRIPRPVHVHYNPYTETVEVIENKEQVTDIIAELKSQMDNLKDVVKNMS